MKRIPLRSFNPRAILIRDCDNLFREIIRLRDKVCQRSGSSLDLQVAHFFSRSLKTLRWDEDNACLLQKGIHYFWAHSKYEEFRDWWISRIGKEAFSRLKLKAQYKGTIHTYELKIMKIALQMRLKELER